MNKKKILLIIIIVIIFGSISGVIAVGLSASEISYNNTTVKNAVDELYSLYNDTYAYWFDSECVSYNGTSDVQFFINDEMYTLLYDNDSETLFLHNSNNDSFYTMQGEIYEPSENISAPFLATGNSACYHPKIGGSAVSSAAEIMNATGGAVYIKTSKAKHEVCTYVDNKEVCFSQPYNQYGLSNHIVNNNFTSVQKNNLNNALKNVFASAGISASSVNCDETDLMDITSCCYDESCVYVLPSGKVYIEYYNGVGYTCEIGTDGAASCDHD